MSILENLSMKKNVDFNMSSDENSDDYAILSCSSSSEDLAEEDFSSSSSASFGPLFELSELMAHLPIKRGLSKYYHGKAQSFTSMASVANLEDLAKKESSYNQRMKACKSYECNLDGRKYGPKAIIAKKSTKGSYLTSLGSRVTSRASCRPSISIEKTF